MPFGLRAVATATASSDQGDSSAYFGNTITLLGLELVDQNGHVVPATFTSDQGFNYMNLGDTSAVPEPSSLVMLGTVTLAGLGAWARGRRWSHARASRG